ncbi:MAG: hypothetical protein ABIL45_04390 [candidate division WOR-3 bacterium]
MWDVKEIITSDKKTIGAIAKREIVKDRIYEVVMYMTPFIQYYNYVIIRTQDKTLSVGFYFSTVFDFAYKKGETFELEILKRYWNVEEDIDNETINKYGRNYIIEQRAQPGKYYVIVDRDEVIDVYEIFGSDTEKEADVIKLLKQELGGEFNKIIDILCKETILFNGEDLSALNEVVFIKENQIRLGNWIANMFKIDVGEKRNWKYTLGMYIPEDVKKEILEY